MLAKFRARRPANLRMILMISHSPPPLDRRRRGGKLRIHISV